MDSNPRFRLLSRKWADFCDFPFSAPGTRSNAFSPGRNDPQAIRDLPVLHPATAQDQRAGFTVLGNIMVAVNSFLLPATMAPGAQAIHDHSHCPGPAALGKRHDFQKLPVIRHALGTVGRNSRGLEAARHHLFTRSWWNCREIAGVLFHRIFDIGMRLEKRGELGLLR